MSKCGGRPSGSARLRSFASGHRRVINDIAWSSNSRLALTAAADGMVKVWLAAEGKCMATLGRLPLAPVVRCAFSPDGQRALAASNDATLRLWPLPVSVRAAAGFMTTTAQLLVLWPRADRLFRAASNACASPELMRRVYAFCVAMSWDLGWLRPAGVAGTRRR